MKYMLLMLLMLMTGCVQKRIYWLSDTDERCFATNREERVYQSKIYGCEGWYPDIREVR